MIRDERPTLKLISENTSKEVNARRADLTRLYHKVVRRLAYKRGYSLFEIEMSVKQGVIPKGIKNRNKQLYRLAITLLSMFSRSKNHCSFSLVHSAPPTLSELMQRRAKRYRTNLEKHRKTRIRGVN